MSSDDGDNQGGWWDDYQEDHGDEAPEPYISDRYRELDVGDDDGNLNWPHRDPDHEYGGVAWGEYETYIDYEQARETYDYLVELIDNHQNLQGHQEVGRVHMFINDNYEWEVRYIVFVEGGTGDS